MYLGGPLALEIMTPFILAFIMAWAFNPVVRGLQRKLGATRKVYSFIMVILFYALLGFLIVMFGKVLISQVIGLARSLPSILSQMQDTYQQLMEQLRMVMEKVPDQYAEIEAELFTAIDTAWQWFKGALSTLLSRAVSWDEQRGDAACRSSSSSSPCWCWRAASSRRTTPTCATTSKTA